MKFGEDINLLKVGEGLCKRDQRNNVDREDIMRAVINLCKTF